MHNIHTKLLVSHKVLYKIPNKYTILYITVIFLNCFVFFHRKRILTNTYRHTTIDILIKVKTIEKYWVHDIYFDSAKNMEKN